MFGGEGVNVENVEHEQRRVIKYNHLVANMVILYNVQWMSRKLKELQQKVHPVDADVLKVLAPCRREHINRLGELSARSAMPRSTTRSDHRFHIQISSLGRDLADFF